MRIDTEKQVQLWKSQAKEKVRPAPQVSRSRSNVAVKPAFEQENTPENAQKTAQQRAAELIEQHKNSSRSRSNDLDHERD